MLTRRNVPFVGREGGLARRVESVFWLKTAVTTSSDTTTTSQTGAIVTGNPQKGVFLPVRKMQKVKQWFIVVKIEWLRIIVG